METGTAAPRLDRDPISYTAKIVAAKRAIEQLHPTPLFYDPFAIRLAEDEVTSLLNQWQEVAQSKGTPLEEVIIKRTRYIAIRTRFIDDLLTTALSQAQNYQVVILGAGLDTRAFRLTYPSNTAVYEVDQPVVLQHKSTRLHDIAPRCQHYLVPGDLADRSSAWMTELSKAGYQDHTPTIWLMEGVMMYLKPQAVYALLNTLSIRSAAGSLLALDGVTAGSIQAGHRAEQFDRGRVIRHWQFGDDHPQQLLATYGWEASVYQPQQIENGYGRYPKSIPIQGAISEPQDNRGVWLVKGRCCTKEGLRSGDR
jgi:methyltransferase (TIGR00027 family)